MIYSLQSARSCQPKLNLGNIAATAEAKKRIEVLMEIEK